MHDATLPNGFALTPDLIVGEKIRRSGLAITYRCHDRSLSTDVILYEYFPPRLAMRSGDRSVAPKACDVTEPPPHQSVRPLLSLSSTVVVRGIPGGDASPTGLFEWGLRRFMEEASLLAKLNHPSIPRIFRAFRQNGTGYMTQQLVMGGTLENEVRKREFTQEDLDKLAEPLLDALDHLHSHGLIHRDVTPEHIVVRADSGATMLSGLVTAMRPSDHFQTTGMYTPRYAPIEEYINDQAIGPWTDIYGLAASLYYTILKTEPPSAVLGYWEKPGPPLE